MRVTWEIFGSALVVLGDFNPAIFSPDWLERHELIGPADAEAARSDPNLVVSHQVAGFSTDWFSIQVLGTRLVLNSVGPVMPSLRDLATGIFSLLPHVPVSSMGINFMAHYKIPDSKTYHLIGDTLAPKGPWTRLYPGPKRSAGLERLAIKIEPCERGETPPNQDSTNIAVEPSKRITQGIYLTFNSHRDVSFRSSPTRSPAEVAADLLRDEFEPTWNEAIAKFDELLALASEGTI